MAPIVTLALALVTTGDPPAPKLAPQEVVAALETAVGDAIERARPSVVAILRVKSADGQTRAVRGHSAPQKAPRRADDPFAGNEPRPPSAFEMALPGDFGAGVVIGEKGEILTVYHLLQGAEEIRVRAAGAAEFAAEILAADPRSDLAVIAPRAEPGEASPNLLAMPLGDAGKLRAGAFLLALGNPYNAARDGQASASWGILANTARRVQPPAGAEMGTLHYFRHQPTLLQLDAKLNIGLSGGPVVDLRGRLVGITTDAASPVGFDAAAGYAIPIDDLGRRAVEALRQGKEVEYGFLGITMLNGAPNRVDGVMPGTPAFAADLIQGDQILAVGDKPVPEEDGALSLALSTVPVGQAVKLRVRRGTQVLERSILMSKFPVAGPIIATNRPAPWRGIRVDFPSVLDVGTHPKDVLEAMSKGGVGVVEVETGSPAESAGLRKGQIITAINNKPVATPAAFHDAVSSLRGPVRLTTEQGDAPGKTIVVK